MALRHHDLEPEPAHPAMTHAHTTSAREPFGVGQIVAVAAGIFFIVTGAIGLARAGLDSLTEPTVEVMELGMTPLLALIHLGVGVIALLGAATRMDARVSGLFVGALLIAAGIVALAQPVESLGWNRANGIAYLIAGCVVLIAGLVTPLMVREDRVVSH